MNVLHQYTRKSLLSSRTRTAVTVIGIILSVAMLTAVTTLISSAQQYMIDSVTLSEGGWHCAVYQVSGEDAASAASDSRTEWAAGLDCLGYASYGEETTPGKPYLYVCGMQDGFGDRMPVRLTAGRLPQTPEEVLIPVHLLDQTSFEARIGDRLELTLGDRVSEDGLTCFQTNPVGYDEDGNPQERLVEREKRSYTVVGLYERPCFEDYYAPGYTLLTVSDGSSGLSDLWVRLRDPNAVPVFCGDHFDGYDGDIHRELLRATGSSGESAYNAVLYSLGTIFIVIILFASVFLICNAFSISVSERTRQFGLLSSVGATRRQLTHCVLYEAAVLSAIGIPLGVLSGMAGIGITLTATSGMFDSLLSLDAEGVSMHLAVSWQSIAVAALLGLTTVLFSAWLPARRATRMSAIDAIRQTADIRIRPRTVRTSRLTYRLFGFEGMLAAKNFKRARRKYRVTVFSLSVSILLFVSASSFCTYLSDSAEDLLQDFSFDLLFQHTDVRRDDAEDIHLLLARTEGISASALHSFGHLAVEIPSGSLSGNFLRDNFEDPSAGTQTVFVGVTFCDDAVFAEFAEKLGLGEEYLDGDRLIAVNRVKTQRDGRYYTYQPLTGPVTVRAGDRTLEVGCLTGEFPYGTDLSPNLLTLLCPASAEDYLGLDADPQPCSVFSSPDHEAVYDRMVGKLREDGLPTYPLTDYAQGAYAVRSLLTLVNVFSYGFITLISLIALANVFNTISTNVQLRRREFASLLSVGMTRRSFRRMMNYECLLYGVKGLMYGLPLSFAATWLIHRSITNGLVTSFYMPWGGVLIAVASVFVVVFVTMLYAMRKLRGCELMDALKTESI